MRNPSEIRMIGRVSLPAVSSALTAVIAVDPTTGFVNLSENGGAFSPLGTLASAGWTRDSAATTVRLTDATDEVAIGIGVAPVAGTKLHVEGDAAAVAPAIAARRRTALGAAIVAVSDHNGVLMVAVDDNGNLDLEPLAAAAGNDSRSLLLRGVTNTATRNVELLNEADAGADTYRLRVNDHLGAGMLMLERTAAERRARVTSVFGVESTSTPAVLAANADNLATAGASVVLQDTGGNFNVTGFADGYDGKLLWFQNTSNVAGGTNDLTLTHEDAASAPGNQIRTPNNASVVIRNNGAALLRYDGAISRWRVLSAAL